MSSGLSIPMLSGAATETSFASPAPKNDPARVKHAAEQFEALMIGQMMKSIREAEESGPMAEEKDQAGGSAMQLAQEQFAQALAARGGLAWPACSQRRFRLKIPAARPSRRIRIRRLHGSLRGVRDIDWRGVHQGRRRALVHC